MYFGSIHIPLELTTQSFQFHPQGHSATVPCRVTFYLFNFSSLKFSHSSSCSNQLACILLSGHCLFFSQPWSQCIGCLFPWKLFFFNNAITFTWLRAVNAPRDHWEPPWLPPGPNVITIQSTIGHPKKEKRCMVFRWEVTKWQRHIFPLDSKCELWLLSPSPPHSQF